MSSPMPTSPMPSGRVPTITLNDGALMPQIGLGTWPLDDREAERVVVAAVERGYRLVDTAAKYGNERGVGAGVRASGLPRGDLFVTTKLDGAYQGADRAVAGLDGSLQRLGLDYVDLLLIHWPLPRRGLYVDTWRTFERLQRDGRARSIGVSNFKPAHLERLRGETTIVPAVNQVQLYPGITQDETRAYDAAAGIVTQSYSPLGQGNDLLRRRTVREIAARHGRTPAQVVLRWHVQLGLGAVPKSADPGRLAQNITLFDFQLGEDEMAALCAVPPAQPPTDSDTSGH